MPDNSPDDAKRLHSDDAKRLHRLAGRRCPVCVRSTPNRPPETLYFDGKRLTCGRGHSYSSPDAAEAQVTPEANPCIL